LILSSYKRLYPILALYVLQERMMESLAFLDGNLRISHYPFLLFDRFKQPHDSMCTYSISTLIL